MAHFRVQILNGEENMQTKDQGPTFNLKAVVRETGLKHDTLRAWERRYGLPQPQRTSGGHRLYTQRDIEILKWLVARQQEGLSISRAVDMWRQLEADNQDPLQAVSTTTPTSVNTLTTTEGSSAINDLCEAWEAACMAFDEQEAEQILTQAFALYPPEVVCFELLLKAMSSIGDGWHAGKVTVQQEHFASALAIRRLEALLAATPPPTRPGRVLIGCPSQEEHIFSPLLITLLLRRQGLEVIYLGANVPVNRLENTISTTKPHLVILAAQLLPTAAHLLEMVHLLKKEKVPTAYGGRIFNYLPELRKYISAHFLGERIDEVPKVVERLLASPGTSPEVKPIPDGYQEALDHYRERQALVESKIWQKLREVNLSQRDLNTANANVAQHIIAALTLGDIEFLGTNIEWVEMLLAMMSYRLPTKLLPEYFAAYHQGVEEYLDERGQPIKDWLKELTANLIN